MEPKETAAGNRREEPPEDKVYKVYTVAPTVTCEQRDYVLGVCQWLRESMKDKTQIIRGLHELGQLERDKDSVYIGICEIARQWIRD